MQRKLPVYEIVIDENVKDESGVEMIAFVDDPAVQKEFMVFSESKPLTFVADTKRWIITAVAMRANYPIYRNDEKYGEHYVKFSPDVIESIVKKFSKQQNFNRVNEMHDKGMTIDEGVYMIESFMVDSSRGISAPKGLEVEEGSWIVSYFVENPEIRKKIEDGTYRGISVEGLFGYDFISQQFSKHNTIQNDIDHILNILSKIG